MPVVLTVDTDRDAGDPIDPRFFGGNFLMGRDRLDGTFDDTFEDLELQLMRWPGGGIAEDHFDVTDPDAEHVDGQGVANTLSGFLAYCVANNTTAAIVIPVKKYAGDVARAEAEVRTFVADLVAGVYGPLPADTILEIGNEYYANSANYDSIKPTEYGEIASHIVTVIEDETAGAIDIGVQGGRTQAQNRRILDEFTTLAEKDPVDYLIMHQYPWSFGVIDGRLEKQAFFADLWADAGFAVDVFLSEWNMGSSPNEATADRHDYGLAQNVAMLELVHEMVANGVDIAAIWGIQQRTKTSLASNEGITTLYAAGELYKLMTTSLAGAHALDAPEKLSGSAPIVSYAYETDDTYVVFVAARDVKFGGKPLSVDVLVAGAESAFLGASISYLTTDEPISKPKPRALLSTPDPDYVFDGDQLGVTLEFNRDFEVYRVIFDKADIAGTDVTRIGDAGDNDLSSGTGTDVVKGHKGEDRLVAHAGDDDLRGGAGSDFLDAGSGDDALLGGAGDDTLGGGAGSDTAEGGAGRDEIYGGSGNDVLAGDAGRDKLHGGGGADTLNGGGDNDRLWGGDGSDVFVFAGSFGFDRIWDFNRVEDQIDLTAFGYSFVDLQGRMTYVRVDTHIVLDEGTIAINGMRPGQFSEDDFIFL